VIYVDQVTEIDVLPDDVLSRIFGSPRRLNLRLFCTPKTPAKNALDVWPVLPLLIWGDMSLTSGAGDVVAALGQSNHICQVILVGLADGHLEKVVKHRWSFPICYRVDMPCPASANPPQSRPDWVNRRPPPSKRSDVSALERFYFKGVIE